MAITITPTGKTGMDVGLSDIASILSEQNQVLAQTADAQQKLTSSFTSYLKMLKGDKMDELQDERRSNQAAKAPVASGSSSMRNMIPTKAGIFDYLKTFLKRLVPIALGIVFGDDLLDAIKPKIEALIGTDITDEVMSVITGAAGGSLLGFLFGGVKGGLYGLAIGALTSKGARQKIADGLSAIFNKEINADDWEAWAGSAGGLAALYFTPSLLSGAMAFALSGKVEKTSGGRYRDKKTGRFLKPSLAQKFKAGFGGNAAMAAGVFAVGSAMSGIIGDQLGADAGGLAQDVTNAAAFGAMFGPKGMLIATIGMLAVKGGSAILQHLRGINDKLKNKSFEEADALYAEYEKTGDKSILEAGMEKLGRAQREAQLAVQRGELEHQADYERYTKMMGEGGKTGQAQTELAKAEAARGTLANALDRAYQMAMEKTGGNAKAADFEDSLINIASAPGVTEEVRAGIVDDLPGVAQRLVDRKSSSMSQVQPAPEAIATMNKYGARSTGNTIAPVDASTANIVTNNSSAPMVLPSGGSQDISDSKRAMLLTTTGL
jgi:hypothetical protein